MLAIMPKPVSIGVLLDRVASAVEGTPALIVEDDAQLAQNLAELLSERGYSARIAHTCAEARRIIAASRPAVALVDWRLPDCSGAQLVEEINAVEKVMTILFTGVAPELEEAKRRAAQSGAHFFEKPLAIERLFELLEAARPPKN
jgi:DNA-binding response OmpR family regulator